MMLAPVMRRSIAICQERTGHGFEFKTAIAPIPADEFDALFAYRIIAVR
jgi:hypothetical protein